MKKILLFVAIGFAFSAKAQWVIKNVNDDPFEDPYKICYVSGVSNKNNLLKLEEYEDGSIFFYASLSYVCDENVPVELSFKIGNEWQRHSLPTCIVLKNKIVVLSMDLKNEPFYQDFLKSSEAAFLINESHCEDERERFLMSGSTAASQAWDK
jgi:hypothetical protein